MDVREVNVILHYLTLITCAAICAAGTIYGSVMLVAGHDNWHVVAGLAVTAAGLILSIAGLWAGVEE
jgi:hypothetical protein